MQRAASSCPEAVRALHTILEISHRTRDSHISTADHRDYKNEERTEDWTDATQSGTLSAPSDERNSGGIGFENPGSIPSENRHLEKLKSRRGGRFKPAIFGIIRFTPPLTRSSRNRVRRPNLVRILSVSPSHLRGPVHHSRHRLFICHRLRNDGEESRSVGRDIEVSPGPPPVDRKKRDGHTDFESARCTDRYRHHMSISRQVEQLATVRTPSTNGSTSTRD